MLSNLMPRALLLAVILLSTQPLVAKDKGYPAVPLLSTETTIVGEPLSYPDSGQAHVNAAIVTIAPGDKTILHKHGVPLFAYILDGELIVDYGDSGKRTYKKGDAFMEAMSVAHYGINETTEPVRILAVYMGAEGSSNVIKID